MHVIPNHGAATGRPFQERRKAVRGGSRRDVLSRSVLKMPASNCASTVSRQVLPTTRVVYRIWNLTCSSVGGMSAKAWRDTDVAPRAPMDGLPGDSRAGAPFAD